MGTVCFKTFGAGKLLGDTAGYGKPLEARPRHAQLAHDDVLVGAVERGEGRCDGPPADLRAPVGEARQDAEQQHAGDRLHVVDQGQAPPPEQRRPPRVVHSPRYEVDIGVHVFPTAKYRLVRERRTRQ